VIHTLTVNPALDLTYRVREISFDDTVRADEVLRAAGGKGINVSRVVQRLGHPTVAMGFLGGRTGDEVREHLEAESVRTWFTHTTGETRTNAIVQDAAGHQVRVSGPGLAVTAAEVEGLVESLFHLRAPEMLAVSGSVLPGMPEDFYATITRRAVAEGVRVAVDADGAELLAGIAAGAAIIKPNRYELERLTGSPVGTREDAARAAQPLIEDGLEAVLCSLGSQGAVLATRECTLHAFAPRVRVDSAVGAGDAMLAGALVALVEGRPWEHVLRLGVACGTATALTPGTELCHPEDLRDLLPRIVVEPL
jgi:6-phosphofructokinase 2